MFQWLLSKHAAAVSMQGKPIKIQWTGRAQRALARRARPLVVEMVLEYKCMPVKSVLFHDAAPGDCAATPVTDRIAICMQVRAPLRCETAGNAQTPGTVPTPPPKTQIPKQLWFDRRGSQWIGEFFL